jgi:hypothetical protein
MPTVKFDRITLVQRLVSGCAVLFTTCALIEHAEARPGYVPPPTPPPPPVFNPSNPGTGDLTSRLGTGLQSAPMCATATARCRVGCGVGAR